MTVPEHAAYAKVNSLEMYYASYGAPGSGEGTRRPLVLLHGGVHTVGCPSRQYCPGSPTAAGWWRPYCRDTVIRPAPLVR